MHFDGHIYNREYYYTHHHSCRINRSDATSLFRWLGSLAPSHLLHGALQGGPHLALEIVKVVVYRGDILRLLANDYNAAKSLTISHSGFTTVTVRM